MNRGRFGKYGGQFVPETLMPCLLELEAVYHESTRDPIFMAELDDLLARYVGRPTPLYRAERFERTLGRETRVYLKREDLNHTGAHKINNCLGQALLARRMGKTRLVAETGAGQHGVATAAVAARFGMACTVYMGVLDMERQRPNVRRMQLLGARVVSVTSGSRTLKEATSETIRDWVTNVRDTHYIIGSTVGPHPYPVIVRDLQSVIGRETRAQILEREGRLPTDIVACVGGGSNALGMFHAFLGDCVRLVGVEGGGSSAGHAATLAEGRPGVLHGSYSYLLQDATGQVSPAHSIAAGLDYPGVGPEHSELKDSGRVVYERASDDEAVEAFAALALNEGILPALESAHALAYVRRRFEGPSSSESLVVVNLSGRGDKDIDSISKDVTGP